MKERPILFSAPMVRALLAGTKTQTRRVIKAQPEYPRAIYGSPGADARITPRLVPCLQGMGVAWRFEMSKIDGPNGPLPITVIDHEPVRLVCPYGKPGDRLWVREAWRTLPDADDIAPRNLMNVESFTHFEADGAKPAGMGKLRPSMFMPRWASRMTLEITDVRVERLQDISDSDALAEGVERCTAAVSPGCSLVNGSIHCDRYARLWDQINGDGAWAANPWVWAVSFRRLAPRMTLPLLTPALSPDLTGMP